MQKILVIQTAFIGDVILATALLEKLYQYDISSQIDLLVRKGNESLFYGHPFLNEVITWDKKSNKNINLKDIIIQVRKEKYDYIINCQRFAGTGILTVASGAKHTVGFTKNPLSFAFNKKVKHEIGTGEHEITRNQKLIEDITDNVPAKPRLYPTKADYEKVKKYKNTPYICIAPASVWYTKQFPQEKWVELINNINNEYTIYLIGGNNDFNLCQEIIVDSGQKNVVNLAGKLNLLQSAALMKDAKINYTNDSSPLHLASAVNATICAVFCSTVPEFGFGPISDFSKIVQTKINLPCRPCGLHGFKECPKKNFECAYSININDMLTSEIKK